MIRLPRRGHQAKLISRSGLSRASRLICRRLPLRPIANVRLVVAAARHHARQFPPISATRITLQLFLFHEHAYAPVLQTSNLKTCNDFAAKLVQS